VTNKGRSLTLCQYVLSLPAERPIQYDPPRAVTTQLAAAVAVT